MKERDRQGCKGLHVVVVPKEDGLGGFSRHWGKHDEAAARWRLWHIMVASCPLAGATVTVASSRAQAERMRFGENWWPEGKAHFMGPLVEAARKGEPIPRLRASEAAQRYVEGWLHGMDDDVHLVTLTLRNQSTDPARNSDGAAWDSFRKWLEDAGYSVIVLRDTHEEIARCPIGPLPALDVDLRLALYERAAMNCIGNNGPQELLKFSSAPYLVFNLGLESWREHFRKHFGMEFGDQLPWAGKISAWFTDRICSTCCARNSHDGSRRLPDGHWPCAGDAAMRPAQGQARARKAALERGV